MRNLLVIIAVICIITMGSVAFGIASKSEIGTLKWFLFSLLSQIVIYPSILWWYDRLTHKPE